MAVLTFLMTAACCAVSFAAPVQVNSKSTIDIPDYVPALSTGLLFEDIKSFHNLMEKLGSSLDGELKRIYDGDEYLDERVQKATNGLKKMKATADEIKGNKQFTSEGFVKSAEEAKSVVGDFESLMGSIIQIYRKTTALNNEFEKLFPDGTTTPEKITQMRDYFKEKVYNEKDVEERTLYSLGRAFTEGEDFTDAVNAAAKHYYLKKQAGGAQPGVENELSPRDPQTSVDGAPGKQPSTEDATGAQLPKEPSPQSPPQTEQSTGNLNGQQGSPTPAKSSFTYGGLTVATLCYFVLSAF